MNFENINSAVSRSIERQSETGAAFVLTRDGKPIHSFATGLADAEKGTAFTPDTICRAFSCSKIVTATACVQLIERGLLDTSWELGWLIPEFSDAKYVRGGKKLDSPPIRIRDLLNMTSGIAYPGDWHEGVEVMNKVWDALDDSIKTGRPMTTQEFAAAVGKAPLMYAAGDEWMYGSSADILGAVVERVAEMRFSEYLAKNIFEPLGMEDTAFYVPADKRDRLAVLYEGAGESRKLPEYVNLCIYDYDEPPKFESGGAGLFTTANDLAKLGAELACGGKGVISRRGVDFMRTNGLSPEQRKTYNWDSTRGYGYGNLVRVLEDRNLAGTLANEGAFGWDGWTGTYLLCDPKEKLSVTLFVQRCGAGTTQLARDVVNASYVALG